MICFPNAKINLGLSVIEKRDDGMHNLETCIIPIPYFDVLEIRRSESFKLFTDGIDLNVRAEKNLLSKAWNILNYHLGKINPVEVYLYKNIIPESGLGGGSSNVSFFINLLNQFNSLGLSNKEMELMSNKIGADCPFFIQNKPAIVTGTGNILSPIINPVSGSYITLVIPKEGVKTVNAFSRIEPGKSSSVKKIIFGDRLKWRTKLVNDFEDIVFCKIPELKKLKEDFYRLGAYYVSLTGTGSCVYALSDEPLDDSKLKKEFVIKSTFIE